MEHYRKLSTLFLVIYDIVLILRESLIDALTFWVAGFRNVTASYGVNGFTADHRRAFEKHGTERVYIAYDRDEAGDKAAAALAEELMGMGLECFRVQFPKGMDANEYVRKVTPAAKSLGVLLNKAAWLGKGQRPDPHEFKKDYLGDNAKISSYDICACSDKSITIKAVGQCGKPGPEIPTYATW